MGHDDEKTQPLQRRPEDSPFLLDERVKLADMPLANDAERYSFVGELGKGGMGVVRLAKDTRIARPVAVKVLRRQLRDQADFRSRFLVEARVQGQLEHPSIVPVHDLGETPDGDLFFSMKAVRGITLADALKEVKQGRIGKFTRRRLLTAFSSVCLAVDFAHTRGVVHRDLKPANVMLGDFGEVYILDWGIAKLVDQPDKPSEPSLEIPLGDSEATQAGKVLGTPRYMAPERRRYGTADRSTDVFALGVILADIFAADGTQEVPPELAAIVVRATDGDPAMRFPNARELHDVLEKYLDGDRDLELRRTHAEEHARLAEEALVRDDEQARSDAGREIGRALGLDPANPRALRTLMRILSEIPATMPPAAREEIDRVWDARRRTTLRNATFLTAAALLYAPIMIFLGIANWGLFLAWITLTIGAVAGQSAAARSSSLVPYISAIGLDLCALVVLATGAGLTGVVPVTLALVAVAWRLSLRRAIHGLVMAAALIATVVMPFVLSALGVISPIYVVHDDTIVILPHMHHFPAILTQVAIALGTIGGTMASLLYGRAYAVEIRRAEERLTFHAWQLQQLLPPDLTRAASSGAA